MVKKIIILCITLLILVGVGVGIWWYSIPKTPEAQLAKAEKIYLKTELLVPQLAKQGVAQDKIQAYWMKSIKEYEKVIQRFPQSDQASMALLKQGIIYEEKLTQNDAALEIYKKLILTYAASSSATEALYRKAIILADMKKEGPAKLEALEDLKRLINKSPTSALAPKAQFKMGSIYEDIKEYQHAVNEYQKVVDNYPTSEEASQAQYRIAQIAQEKLNQSKEAEAAYAKLQQKYPNSKWAKIAPAMKGKLSAEENSEKASENVQKYYGNKPVDPYSNSQRREEIILEEKVRSTNMEILDYRMQVKLNPPDNLLEAKGEMDVVNKGQATSELRFKLNHDLKVKQVTVNGKPARAEQDQESDLLKILSPISIKSGTKCTVGFAYSGKQTESPSWAGDIIRPEGTFLRFESKWYPQGAWGNMATDDLTIEVPYGFTAVAGGGLIDSKELSETEIFHYRSTIPLFGLMLVTRNYVSDEDSLGNIKLMTYFYKLHSGQSKAYIQEVKKIVQFYSDKFGTYPYPKLAIAEIPKFPGGYGSPSLVMLTDRAFEEGKVPVSLLAHEIAHQWWGNLLSIRLRDDSIPWLSEGFATYSDCLFLEHVDGKSAMQKHLAELAESYRQSVVSKNEESILAAKWGTPSYQPIVYYKGAHVLHALRYLVGDEKFFTILRNFTKQYTGKIITTKDFQHACEQVYGQKLDWFFEQWLGRTGLPSYKLSETKVTKDSNSFKITAQIVQGGTLFKSPLDVTVLTSSGPVTQRVMVDQMVVPIEIITKAQPVSIELDKDNWILQSKPVSKDSRKVSLK